MGYTTDFTGKFKLEKPLTENQTNYINAFSETRRMKRDTNIASGFKDELRESVGLPIGQDGGYYVGNTKNMGQDDDSSILNHNEPPLGQVGLWCQWVVSEDGESIEWDGDEKFYGYVEWLEYIITHFLKRWGHSLSGKVKWQGEDMDDRGVITVEDNKITVMELE